MYHLHEFAFLYFPTVTFEIKKSLIYITAHSAGLENIQTKKCRGKISFKNQNLLLE